MPLALSPPPECRCRRQSPAPRRCLTLRKRALSRRHICFHEREDDIDDDARDVDAMRRAGKRAYPRADAAAANHAAAAEATSADYAPLRRDTPPCLPVIFSFAFVTEHISPRGYAAMLPRVSSLPRHFAFYAICFAFGRERTFCHDSAIFFFFDTPSPMRDIERA